MHKSKCPACGSLHTVKNGIRKGVQTYKCQNCGYQFRNSNRPTNEELWKIYLEGKQTVTQMSASFGVSESTIKRQLAAVNIEWKQPPLSGGGFVHLDVTYWGHGWGVMLAIDNADGKPLYVEFIGNEKVEDYVNAVNSIKGRGYEIRGLIVDGKKGLFNELSVYKIQMCQYHMMAIIRRKLTANPRLMAAKELSDLMKRLTKLTREEFERKYAEWKGKWSDTLKKRSTLISGKTKYTHDRLRGAVRSIDFYLPYLFTYQLPECKGMPNSNNKIEGTFTNLKNKLNNHNGMEKENRKRFVRGFFLALLSSRMCDENEKQEPS